MDSLLLMALHLLGIAIIILLPISYGQNRNSPDLEFVHICGQFPNRYFSYEPCPEDQNPNAIGHAGQSQACSRPGWHTVGVTCRDVNDCYQQRENVAMMCEHGECCAPSEAGGGWQQGGGGGWHVPAGGGTSRDSDTYLWWQTCENGGYFTGKNCRTTNDCRQTYGQEVNPQLGRYEQICLQGECCTTNRELDMENRNNEIVPRPNGEIIPRTDYNPRLNSPNGCLSFNGGRLVGGNARCRWHGDCNRLIGKTADLQQIADWQQLACVQQQCCLMQRQLPPGITDWQQLCPMRQGSFTGMFCRQNDQDCNYSSGAIYGGYYGRSSAQSWDQPLVCELNRYCCTSVRDRHRRQNQGCYDGDLVTGTRCTDDQSCFRGEYCGEMKICCFPRREAEKQEPDYPDPLEPIGPHPSTDRRDNRRTAAFCYNGEQSYVPCEFQQDCLRTQSCVNGLCCVRSGDEWKSACGGAMAVSSCFQDRTCHDSLVCTTSDYCCECLHGQAAGKCIHGCPPNFSCASNGYCCPRCAQGARPHGSCFNGQCGTGYHCVAGNICCPGQKSGGLEIGRRN